MIGTRGREKLEAEILIGLDVCGERGLHQGNPLSLQDRTCAELMLRYSMQKKCAEEKEGKKEGKLYVLTGKRRVFD